MKLAFTVFARDYEYRGKTIHCGPVPQGSAQARLVPGQKNPFVVYTNFTELMRWRKEVIRAAETAIFLLPGQPDLPIKKPWPVRAKLTLFLTSPKDPKRTRPSLRSDGDGDKYERAIFDALTGLVFEDDSQVCEGCWSKEYGAPERVEIEVEALCPIQEKLL